MREETVLFAELLLAVARVLAVAMLLMVPGGVGVTAEVQEDSRVLFEMTDFGVGALCLVMAVREGRLWRALSSACRLSRA